MQSFERYLAGNVCKARNLINITTNAFDLFLQVCNKRIWSFGGIGGIPLTSRVLGTQNPMLAGTSTFT